jgi:hypothetical protein
MYVYTVLGIGKCSSEELPVHNGLKQRHAFSPMPFNSAIGYAIRKVLRTWKSLQLNYTNQVKF